MYTEYFYSDFFFSPDQMVRKRVNAQANDGGESSTSKRQKEEDIHVDHSKRDRRQADDEEAVDYGEEQPVIESTIPAPPQEASTPVTETIPVTQEDEEKSRITRALESWCRNNISMEKDDPDANDRVAALAEVALLLVLEYEKYPNADSMRAELEDIGSVIGGDQVVTRYINFILSLQNQLKKTRAQAERNMRQQQHMNHQFVGHPGNQFAFGHHQGGMIPMMMHPGGQPMYIPGHQVPMYMGPHGFPMAPPQQLTQPRGNLTLNATGEMTALQKQKEKERKRKEILAECTEHLKALLERVTKSTDAAEKAKIYELIDKVKKRIDSLKEVSPPSAPSQKGSFGKGPIRGYYGNQYVNPNLLAQQSNPNMSQQSGEQGASSAPPNQ